MLLQCLCVNMNNTLGVFGDVSSSPEYPESSPLSEEGGFPSLLFLDAAAKLSLLSRSGNSNSSSERRRAAEARAIAAMKSRRGTKEEAVQEEPRKTKEQQGHWLRQAAPEGLSERVAFLE